MKQPIPQSNCCDANAYSKGNRIYVCSKCNKSCLIHSPKQSIIINCHKCGKRLNELGALVFSPPIVANDVMKFHICRKCYYLLFNWMKK